MSERISSSKNLRLKMRWQNWRWITGSWNRGCFLLKKPQVFIYVLLLTFLLGTGPAWADPVYPQESELLEVSQVLPGTMVAGSQWQKGRLLPGYKTGNFYESVNGDLISDSDKLVGTFTVGKAYKYYDSLFGTTDVYLRLIIDGTNRVVWYKYNPGDFDGSPPFVLEKWLTDVKKHSNKPLWTAKIVWDSYSFVHATKWYPIKLLNVEKVTLLDAKWYSSDEPLMLI